MRGNFAIISRLLPINRLTVDIVTYIQKLYITSNKLKSYIKIVLVSNVWLVNFQFSYLFTTKEAFILVP